MGQGTGRAQTGRRVAGSGKRTEEEQTGEQARRGRGLLVHAYRRIPHPPAKELRGGFSSVALSGALWPSRAPGKHV
jgi:hypothetical protein